jgi:hypothetical protein
VTSVHSAGIFIAKGGSTRALNYFFGDHLATIRGWDEIPASPGENPAGQWISGERFARSSLIVESAVDWENRGAVPQHMLRARSETAKIFLPGG